MKSLSMLLLLLLLSLDAVAESQTTKRSLNVGVSAGITLDDNISRAELSTDIEEDTITALEASASWTLPVNAISYAVLRATLAINQHSDFDKLSNNRPGVDASYFIKPVQGFTAVEYFARLRYEQLNYDSEQREGDATRLALGLSKRLTDRIALQLGFVDEAIDAAQTTYDVDNQRLYLDVDYLLLSGHSLYVTLSRTDGEIVATTVPSTDIINAASSIVRDDAYLALTPARFAYRLDADTTALKLGYIWSIDRYQGLDLSFLSYDSEAAGYNNYDGSIISLFYSYNF